MPQNEDGTPGDAFSIATGRGDKDIDFMFKSIHICLIKTNIKFKRMSKNVD